LIVFLVQLLLFLTLYFLIQSETTHRKLRVVKKQI